MKSNKSYVKISPEVIEQARQMDLLTYLQRYEPGSLKRVAGVGRQIDGNANSELFFRHLSY